MLETYEAQLNPAPAPDYYHSFFALKMSAYASAKTEEGREAVISELVDLCLNHEHTISEQDNQLAEKERIIAEQGTTILDLQDSNAEKDDIIYSQQVALDANAILFEEKDEIIDLLHKKCKESNKLLANYEAVNCSTPTRALEKMYEKYYNLKDKYDEGEIKKKSKSKSLDDDRISSLSQMNAALTVKLQKSEAKSLDYINVRRESNFYKYQYEQDEKKIAQLKNKLDAVINHSNEQAQRIIKLENDLDYELKKGKHGSKYTDQPKSKDHPGQQDTNEFNHRPPTDRKPGGQPGHKKNTAKEIPDELCDEVKEIIVRNYNPDCPDSTCYSIGADFSALCPACGHEAVYTGNTKKHITYETKTIIKKIVEIFYEVQCTVCGKVSYVDRPGMYGETDIQYGPYLNATVLTMLNVNYTPINKIVSYIAESTGNRLHISEGYVSKLQRKAARSLIPFIEELKYFLTKSDKIQWDDTVVRVDKEMACIRFYGNEKLKLFIAHCKKDVASVIEDDILTHLPDGAIVGHDHWMGNYKDTLAVMLGEVIHAECNIHLDRRFKKNAFDTQHEEHTKIGELIIKAMTDRRQLMLEGANSFSQEYIDDFRDKITDLLCAAEEKNAYDKQHCKKSTKILKKEKHLINDVRKFYNQYFGWLSNFKIPPDNNLSERALRTLKIRMKVSGQFKNIEFAQNFAIIRSYVETCRCNGVSVFYAFERLAEGNPMSLDEILNYTTTQQKQAA